MPIHDWTRVSAGTFHAFHLSWISEMQLALNDGLLPPGYYAQAEQVLGPYSPDVTVLEAGPTGGYEGGNGALRHSSGGVALAEARPAVRVVAEGDPATLRPRAVVVRHGSDDRIVALIEIVSPSNKSGAYPFRAFTDKVVGSLYAGRHVLLVDLFPPTPRDPQGVHAFVWSEFSAAPFVPPPGLPLTLAAYSAGVPPTAYVEPTAAGRELIDMPVFLDPESYVPLPLGPTYASAFRGVPGKYKAALAGE